ncbi:hypothetical protein PPL_02962 [Heterostelium album PN500]|uniref:Uncharacterized protein n=1 Tax=Heterostelium pallidum (strain ATCC 26659 / Pp 5 / PN500) TaxID=670386 RepID=D3B3J4_HETP5|nr:hypothetical protein PPL_02962 [Heterostelium album PN500]EFA83892.1 hypothetical protein PPL_02962 [Heterostelium album PN500]|eukprot:XP_020436009.1 hypothetical protein PPL_02962 [Heterostelium album PN500]
MKINYLLSIVIILTIALTGANGELTSTERMKILNEMNWWRFDPTPLSNPPMGAMSWNSTYANQLQEFVDKCANGYSPNALAGNVSEYVISYKGDWNVTVVLNYILSTKVNYNFTTKSCNPGTVCLHSYAVVSKMKSFACALNKCNDTYRFYCNFDPVGPYRGVNPYEPKPVPTKSPVPTTTPTPTPTKTTPPTPTPTKTTPPTPAPTQTTGPISINWRAQSTPVRNQGQCGSCYIFSAIAGAETRYVIKTGADPNTVDFSEQECLNCISNGCNGGWYTMVFDALKNEGFGPESATPYTQVQTTCVKTAQPRVPFAGYTTTGRSKEKLIESLKTGPVTIALWVDEGWQNYRSGIYSCAQQNNWVNHGVLLTGYDLATNSWLIKNSWGTSWGEGGYIRMTANNDNCNIYGSSALYVNY